MTDRDPRTRTRALAVLVVVAGAAMVSGAAFAPWWRRDYDDPLTGRLVISADGTAVAAALFPLALAALAGLAAALATRGALRRVIGAIVAAVGLGSAATAITAAFASPDAALVARLTRPAAAVSSPDLVVIAPVLGALGGVVIAVGGLAVMRWLDRPRSSQGGAYSPPAAQRDAARAAAQRRATGRDGGGDPTAADRSEWWRSLDAGFDPTDDAVSDAGGRLGRRDGAPTTLLASAAADPRRRSRQPPLQPRHDEVAGPPSGARSEQSDAASGDPLSDGYDEHTRSVGREETDK